MLDPHSRRVLVTLLLVALAACSKPPVEWSGDRMASVNTERLAITATGDVVDDGLARFESLLLPPTIACAGTLRLSRTGSTVFAVWWSPRADSGARLLSAHTTDNGATWSAVAPVDTLDVGVAGCRRAPPSIVADSSSGYVHIAYAMRAPEGAGLFFAHSMDRGASFHAPVPLLYGDRLGRTAIAADGDRVAVAFEDPNSASPRVGLALSRTMGHIFEDRLLPVSFDNSTASYPLVAVDGTRISIAWRERTVSGGAIALRIRSGSLH
jgi:hypothetical protein